MANADSSPPDVRREMDLADEIPGPTAHGPAVERIDRDEIEIKWNTTEGDITARVRVGDRFEYPVSFLFICLATTGAASAAVWLCLRAQAPGWATLLVGTAVAASVMSCGLWRFHKRT